MATPNLALPELVTGQTQAETTHNLALLELSVLTQGLVKDRDLTTPPGSPVAGDTYIPLATATDEWTGHEDDIAWFDGASWQFKVPNEGWSFRVADENIRIQWDGAAWVDILADAGGGALVFVSETEITGSPASNLDVTGLDSTAKTWILRVFIEATADGAVQIVLGLVAAFKASGYRFHNHQGQDNSATYIAQVGTSDNQFAIGQNQAESTVTSPHRFTFTIYDPGETDRRKFCEWNGVQLNNSARADAFWGGGVSDVDDTAFDTVRTRIPGTTLAVGTKAFLYKLAEA